MKIAGIIISAFNNSYQQGEASIKKNFSALNIPLLEEIQTIGEDFLLTLEKKYFQYDAIAIGYSDSEFYSISENRRLLNDFIEYQGEIGFGDNYPLGVIFEILRKEILSSMNNLRIQNKIKFTRNFVQDIINVDLNIFDLENLYTKVNLRTLRLNFFSDNIQNQFTINRIKSFLPIGTDLVETEFTFIAKSILENRKKLNTIPKFFEISLTNQVIQPYLFYPPPSNTTNSSLSPTYLSFNDYQTMLKKIIAFSHKPIISFNGLGEMTANPQWKEMVRYTLEKNIDCILETSGVLWSNEISEEISNWANYDRLKIIFLIDTLDEKLYQIIRSNVYPLTPILEKVEYLLLRYGKNVYVQATKTNETFKYLNEFYEYFKKFTKNIIIYKYNTYRGILPERRTEPMQPFEKIDCWHLKRDLKINEKGQVLVCKQDVEKKHILGNLIKDELSMIFVKLENYFHQHIEGWDFCKNCDEYYTYNF